MAGRGSFGLGWRGGGRGRKRGGKVAFPQCFILRPATHVPKAACPHNPVTRDSVPSLSRITHTHTHTHTHDAHSDTCDTLSHARARTHTHTHTHTLHTIHHTTPHFTTTTHLRPPNSRSAAFQLLVLRVLLHGLRESSRSVGVFLEDPWCLCRKSGLVAGSMSI